MALARIYIDGNPWEIQGNATDSFMRFANTLSASRGGAVYAATESRVPTVSFDSIMTDIDDFPEIADWLNECSGRRFNVTLEFLGTDCSDLGALSAGVEYNYLGCMIQGEPEMSLTESKISSFEFGYTERVVTGL